MPLPVGILDIDYIKYVDNYDGDLNNSLLETQV